MFIIASEQTRELDRLQKYLDKLGQPYRVFVTNLETDLDQQTELSLIHIFEGHGYR